MSIITQGLGGNETSLILQGYYYSLTTEVVISEESILEEEWFYEYPFKFKPVEKIIAGIIYPFEGKKRVRSNLILGSFEEAKTIKSRVVLNRFGETIPVISYIIIEFIETRQVASDMIKKFDETCQVNAFVSIYFSQEGKVFAETKSTEEDISDVLEWEEEKKEIEKLK